MPRRKRRQFYTDTPNYCEDRATGRAYVRIAGRKTYLGVYGSTESRDAYDRVIAEWEAAGRPRIYTPKPEEIRPTATTVRMVLAAFWAHAQQAYPAPTVPKGKRPSGELGIYFDLVRLLNRIYGPTPAKDFGPRALRAVRQVMIDGGACRNTINRQISRVKMIFKWAVGDELIPGEVYYRLMAVPGLRKGREKIRESEPVRAVPDDRIDAITPHVSPQIAAMIRLEHLTGMRPGEVCLMRACDIDTTGRVWVYTPERHKTEHHGHARQIRIGPKAQEVLKPFLKPALAAYVFSPAEAEAERNAERRKGRQTPMTPSQNIRLARASGTRRKRPPQDRYDVASYRRAIARACVKAFGMPAELREPIPGSARAREETPEARTERRKAAAAWRRENIWRPNQLRHTAATNIRRDYGLDAVQAILGHRTLTTTQIYAELDGAKADRIMEQVG